MTKQTRADRLMPGGVPRYVRAFDNGGIDAGGSYDRYTVVYTGRAATSKGPDGRRWFSYVGMSASPFHPQGFGQHGENPDRQIDVNPHGWPPAIGRSNHLGRRINFSDLPPDCQRLVISDYREIWKL